MNGRFKGKAGVRRLYIDRFSKTFGEVSVILKTYMGSNFPVQSRDAMDQCMASSWIISRHKTL